MSSAIQNSSISRPRLIPAAMGLEPAMAICTSPSAMALIIWAPESNWRQAIERLVLPAKAPVVMATFHGL